MRRATGLLLLLWMAGCGDAAPIPATDLQLVVSAEVERIELGEGFPLTVVRIWNKTLVPEPFAEAMLAPLALVLEAEERREDAERVMETRRFRAYAFNRRDVVVPAPHFRAAPVAGGEARIAKADTLRLRVTPLLDPAEPGLPELPGSPLAERVSWAPLWAFLAVALAAGVLGFVRTRRRVPGDRLGELAPRRRSAEADALQALGVLRGEAEATPASRCATVSAVADVLRAYLAAAYGLPTRERTSPEILGVAASRAELTPAFLSGLSDVFTTCDLTKFAGRVPTSGERDEVLDAAAQLLHGVER